MNVKEAKKLARKHKDPQTLESVIDYIYKLSELGFSNTSLNLSNRKRKAVIVTELSKLGYKVYDGDPYLEVEWF